MRGECEAEENAKEDGNQEFFHGVAGDEWHVTGLELRAVDEIDGTDVKQCSTNLTRRVQGIVAWKAKAEFWWRAKPE